MRDEDGLLLILTYMVRMVFVVIFGVVFGLVISCSKAEATGFPENEEIVLTYQCTSEDEDLRAEYEVVCVGENPMLVDMCRRYSAEMYCEVYYDSY
jgi:hypothetical protein